MERLISDGIIELLRLSFVWSTFGLFFQLYEPINSYSFINQLMGRILTDTDQSPSLQMGPKGLS